MKQKEGNNRTMNKKITFTEALLTAVGLVIGSGIFYRADDILGYTKGNVGIAVLGWILLGIMIVFAGIGMSVLALRSKREGGYVGYMEDVFGPKAGFIMGWFVTFVNMPLLIGIMSTVSANYTMNLFGMESNQVTMHIIAALYIIIIYAWNYFSTKFAAIFSSVATIIKFLPIVVIGLVGLTQMKPDLIFGSQGLGSFDFGLFVAPLLSMAFAFDGWASVTSLARDMENPQKDLARILALNAIIVTVAYLLYFTGISMLAGSPQEIIAAGDNHVSAIANKVLFGAIGEKIIVFCIIVSVLGTINGNMMAAFRFPHALACSKNLPNSDYFIKETKYGTTGRASFISIIPIVFWWILYTIRDFAEADAKATGKTDFLFSTIRFDDIGITSLAILLGIILFGTIIIGRKEKLGVFKSLIAPIIGIIGQVFIVVSFFTVNSAALLYLGIVMIIIVIGLFIRGYAQKQQKGKMA